MNIRSAAIRIIEQTSLPDAVIGMGIARLVGRTSRRLAKAGYGSDEAFAAAMAGFAVAEHPDMANVQHYELPAEFFRLVLGPRLKYSCGRYTDRARNLQEAELCAIEETADHAGLADGQQILELGCGWGSLTLFMAERYPQARIVAVSNAQSQRRWILDRAAEKGLENIEVVTADMNDFRPDRAFDRIVSVEMFEHISNWGELLSRLRLCLSKEGRLFLHVFTHSRIPYRFDAADPADWIARHFFTGGIMPSRGLIRQFGRLFSVEGEWSWSGLDYQRTALDWLANYDRGGVQIEAILRRTYDDEWRLWRRRWRLFFLATAGLFGHAGGREWGVSHYRLEPR